MQMLQLVICVVLRDFFAANTLEKGLLRITEPPTSWPLGLLGSTLMLTAVGRLTFSKELERCDRAHLIIEFIGRSPAFQGVAAAVTGLRCRPQPLYRAGNGLDHAHARNTVERFRTYSWNLVRDWDPHVPSVHVEK